MPTRERAGVRAALFDVDGVILDSIGFHRRVWRQYCDTRRLPFERVWPTVLCHRWPDVLSMHVPHLDAELELESLAELCDDFAEITAHDGVVQLLAGLNRRQWGVVTSGRSDAVRQIFLRLAIPLPEVLVDGTEVAVAKPDPEGYLLAAERLAVSPQACLVVEDTPAGIRAARAAGMSVIAVEGTVPVGDLAGAHEIVSSVRRAGAHVRRWLREGHLQSGAGDPAQSLR